MKCKHTWIRFLSAGLLVLAILCGIPVSAEDAEPAATGSRTPDYTAEEQQFIREHPAVKVGFVQDRIPVSFADKNGEAAGISRYIFDRVSELSGLTFNYEALPTGDVTYDYLVDNGFDLVTSVEYNEENKKARGILISEPYLSSRKVIVAKDDLDFRYDGEWTVAISTGSQTLKKVLAASFPNFKLKDYDSIAECFDAINSGEADLMIQNQYVVEYWLSRPKYEKLKVIPVLGLDDIHCFSAVFALEGQEGPSYEDGAMLLEIIDKAILCMGEDEEGNYIIQGVMENQYDYTLTDFVQRYRYACIILCISLLIILTLVVMLTRQQLSAAKSRAESEVKDRFLSMMSHEIRTPLNGLIGLNNLMWQKLDEPEQMHGYLRQSTVTAKYLLSVVNDILDLSRLRSRQMKLSLHRVDLAFVVETVGLIVRDTLSEKNLHYTVKTDFLCPCVNGDEVRIEQVMLHLLDNACKFTHEGGSISLTLTQDMQGEQVLTTIRIADTGRGMTQEAQERVFEAFSRELEGVSKGNQGTGLGLSIARQLARLMGGDLTCESKKGEGSTFTFTFLTLPADAAAEEESLSHNGTRPRVLVAEDNELNREIIVELLHESGFETATAENGQDALKLFRDSAPGTFGVILMDLLMPEMDGYETAKAIRALHRPDAKTVRIIACTANAFADEEERAYACGMDDFLPKPVDIDLLLKKLYETD